MQTQGHNSRAELIGRTVFQIWSKEIRALLACVQLLSSLTQRHIPQAKASMVWPFSSSKPDNSKAASSSSSSTISDAIDSLENAGQDAKAAFESTKASIEDIVSASSPSIEAVQQQLTYIPESAKPYLITSTVFGVSLLAVVFYKNRLRRIPTAAYLTPNMLKGKRVMKGKVTSVGDADNFRFYHTPGGILAGWGWLRHVPTVAKGKAGG